MVCQNCYLYNLFNISHHEVNNKIKGKICQVKLYLTSKEIIHMFLGKPRHIRNVIYIIYLIHPIIRKKQNKRQKYLTNKLILNNGLSKSLFK